MKKLMQMVGTMIREEKIDANGRDHDQVIVKEKKGRGQPMHNQSVDCWVKG